MVVYRWFLGFGAFGLSRGHSAFASKLLCVTVKADDVRSGAKEGTKGSRSEWSNVKSSAVVKDFFIH